jgi:hypothetical protein
VVVSQPSLVYDMGSNNFGTMDKTAANQVWWFCQPLFRFTVLAKDQYFPTPLFVAESMLLILIQHPA